MNKIIIYQGKNNTTQIEVKFEQDTVWLNQEQLMLLFNRNQSVISRHIRNVFKEGELDENSNMQKMHIANSDKPVTFYNLDVIISLGYRVKSKQGTAFRQWATQRLKEHLVQGYTINQKRLDQLQKTVELIQKTASNETSLIETKGLLDIIANYKQSFVLLNQFDSNSLTQLNLN